MCSSCHTMFLAYSVTEGIFSLPTCLLSFWQVTFDQIGWGERWDREVELRPKEHLGAFIHHVTGHTKDGTVKDLVLSSTDSCFSFSLHALFVTLKACLRRGTKQCWPALVCVKRFTSSGTWLFIRSLFPTTAALAQNIGFKCDKAKNIH